MNYICSAKTMMENIRDITRQIDEWIKNAFVDDIELPLQILYKVFLVLLVFYILNLILNKIFSPLIKNLTQKSGNRFYEMAHNERVFSSLINCIAIGLTYLSIDYIFFAVHPKTHSVLDRIFFAALVLVVVTLFFRILNSFEKYYKLSFNYKGTAMVTVLQSIKLFAYFLAAVALIMILFNVHLNAILTTLGATTAIFVLVFRDTILGIISGFNVAASRTIKVGDWISIPKYNLEGDVQEINLLTTKIKNFDKTISTIPTYDLITTEVKNMQVLLDRNSRRINRSVYFNINSFKFMDDVMKEKWLNINLITEYLKLKINEIEQIKETIANSDNIINGVQLTNIGVFRIYIKKYLENHPFVDQKNILVVRQKDISAQGLPLEIYCFTTKGSFAEYENIQADIFDHILVTANYFDLEILQSKI